MKSSSMDDASSIEVLKLHERYCHCGRRVAIKISHFEKNPKCVYVKCEREKCKYWDWVKVGDVERGDSVDSELRPPAVDSELHPNIENKDIALLCDRMARLETAFAMRKQQEEGTNMQGVGNMTAMIIVIVLLSFVILVKH